MTAPAPATGGAPQAGERVPAAQLAGIVTRTAATYQLGRVRSWRVITTGYEDANLAAKTTVGPVVIKVFPAHRAQVAVRTSRLVTDAIAAGLHHPRLHHATGGTTLTRDAATGCHVLVMDTVNGQDFYSPTRAPTRQQLTVVVEQAALIHTIPGPVEPVDNLWALPRLHELAVWVRPYLDNEQGRLVNAVTAAFNAVNHIDLPHRLIHNDLTKGNVLASRDDEVWIIDFGCADWYPRVQELAVIAANLTHGADQPPVERANLVARMYAAHAPLTEPEWDALPAYTGAAAAMEFLGAVHGWHLAGDHRPETRYLIELGLAGLRAWAAADHRAPSRQRP